MIVNARMYSVTPASKAAWRELLLNKHLREVPNNAYQCKNVLGNSRGSFSLALALRLGT
jgi:hypothetical protein